MVIAPSLSGLAAVLILPVPAQGYDNQILSAGRLSHPTSHVVAVHSGQAYVEKDDVGLECAQLTESNFSVLRKADNMAVHLQKLSHTLG
jgi:hypothetical protein